MKINAATASGVQCTDAVLVAVSQKGYNETRKGSEESTKRNKRLEQLPHEERQ